jgi:hypothetical protein
VQAGSLCLVLMSDGTRCVVYYVCLIDLQPLSVYDKHGIRPSTMLKPHSGAISRHPRLRTGSEFLSPPSQPREPRAKAAQSYQSCQM